MAIATINPATGATLKSFEAESHAVVDGKIDQAAAAWADWRLRPIGERAGMLNQLAGVLDSRRDEWARLATLEMGKPIGAARAEVEKCAFVCRHYAEQAERYLADETIESGASRSWVAYQPLGPVLAVMPWNFPYWQVFRFAAPATAAGNVGLLKHASNVPGCAVAIEDVFREAGYPEGVFQSLLVPSDVVADVVADDRVRAATLTGSGPAGRSVASIAGEHLKKTVLELGGSDPFVVLDDADVEAAAETGAWARNLNGGQSCIAAKRFVVQDSVYDEFAARFVEEVESLVVGDPMDGDTQVGPQARRDLMETLHGQVEASVEAGATVLTGGEPMDREGSFYPPTVLADVPAGCPADSEEVFGPVAALFRVGDEDEAVEKANDTEFGLGASVWSQDRERGERVAAGLDAGCTYVNQLVKSDPRVPFGGVKESGYGRELGEAGIKEFVNRKTVWVE